MEGGGAGAGALAGHERGMDSDTHVTHTKETTIEKKTVVHEEPVVEVPEPRHGETITIETHTEN